MASPSENGEGQRRDNPGRRRMLGRAATSRQDSNSRRTTNAQRKNETEKEKDPVVQRYLQEMELYELIGQMSQIDVNMLLEDVPDGGAKGKRLQQDAVDRYIGELAIGSVLNTVSDVQWTARQYREAAIELNQVAEQHGRPPLIWGLDSVHGANYIKDAVLTPQPLNLAATFNVTVAYEAGKLASRDTRAAGIHWLFSPLLGLAVEPRWSRVYETFGEDPVVVGTMAAEMIRGIQAPDETNGNQQHDDDSSGGEIKPVPSAAAACAKHYIGYSAPRTGHDRSPAWIPTRHLYQYFVPPWQRVLSAATEAHGKPLTVMESYSEIDGVPMVGNYDALQYLLRQRLNFGGVLVTDYEEIRNLHNWHRVAPTDAAAVVQTLREGSVDISMIPWDADGFASSIVAGIAGDGGQQQQKQLTTERVRTSAERVLQLKRQLRMIGDDKDNDKKSKTTTETITIVDPNLDLVGTDEAAVYPMVLDSIILAKNEQNLLPLDSTQQLKVHVTGPTANSLQSQTGGWSGQWQGMPSEDWFSYGSTVWDNLHAEAAWHVTYSCGVDILGQECKDEDETGPDENYIDKFTHWAGLTPTNSMALAVEGAKDAHVTIVCVGEEQYTEKPGDIRSLRLPVGQSDLVHAIQRNAPDTKIVLVYFGGRPRLLSDMVEAVDAVVLGFLPGPSAGQAVVDILTGRYNPTGRLPITYPAAEDGGGGPYWHAVTDQCTRGDAGTPLPHWEYIPCPVQWNFGHGLSYTYFAYSDLSAIGGIDEDLHVTVTVKNAGTRAGADTVMFFTFDEARLTTPEYKRLRAFEKVFLAAGESQTIKKTIPLDELRFVGPHDDRHAILDPHMISYLGVGPYTDCRIRDDDHNPDDNDLCVRLQSQAPDKPYVASCEIACNLWKESKCGGEFNMNEKLCLEMCMAVEPIRLPTNEAGWGFNYVRCIEPLVWNILQDQGNDERGPKCWMLTHLCRDIFQTGRLTSSGMTSLSGFEGVDVVCDDTRKRGTKAYWTALLSGLITSVVIWKLIGGTLWPQRRRRRSETDEERFNGIQFTTIQNGGLD